VPNDKLPPKDNIILFPSNKIVEKPGITKPPSNNEYVKRIQQKQTKEFVETAVDDISMNLLRQLYDLAVKTEKQSFTRDLAMVVDMIRGLVYRDFDMPHPSQKLSEKLVQLKKNQGSALSARIDYSSVIDKPAKTNKPLSKDVKEDLKDLNDSTMFEGENLDD
tara:strand:+ start:129 stop:617 length:489 start_codon:yes stop_codon:yes gene_type:complete